MNDVYNKCVQRSIFFSSVKFKRFWWLWLYTSYVSCYSIFILFYSDRDVNILFLFLSIYVSDEVPRVSSYVFVPLYYEFLCSEFECFFLYKSNEFFFFSTNCVLNIRKGKKKLFEWFSVESIYLYADDSFFFLRFFRYFFLFIVRVLFEKYVKILLRLLMMISSVKFKVIERNEDSEKKKLIYENHEQCLFNGLFKLMLLKLIECIMFGRCY